MTDILAPDELVEFLFQQVVYDGGSITFEQLWKYAETKVKLDEDMREFIFAILREREGVYYVDGGADLADSFKASELETLSKPRVVVDEDHLWIELTGATKKDSALGGFCFELLLAIVKKRYNGIDSLELTKVTKQDARSLTSRLKSLEPYIVKDQVIKSKRLLSLLTYKKFAKEREGVVDPGAEELSSKALYPKVVNAVKAAKNGLRQIVDLKRELAATNDRLTTKRIGYMVSYLAEKGCLQKVMVVSPVNEFKKIRCVKYVKDYEEDLKVDGTVDFDEDDDIEEAEDGEKPISKEEELAMQNAFGESSVTIVDESKDDGSRGVTLNRFYPMQNQTFDAVEKKATVGFPTPHLVEAMTGKDYDRAFSKFNELMFNGKGKSVQPDYLGEYSIVKFLDAAGKTKFYRFFTSENFKKLTNPDYETMRVPHWRPVKPYKKSLDQLNKDLHTSLMSSVVIRNENGIETIVWGKNTGAKGPRQPKNPNGAKRGRPKLSEAGKKPTKKQKLQAAIEAVEEAEVQAQKMAEAVVAAEVGVVPILEEAMVAKAPMETKTDAAPEIAIEVVLPEPTSVPNVITETFSMTGTPEPDIVRGTMLRLNGLEASSIRSLNRQRAILKVIGDNEGWVIQNLNLVEMVSEAMNDSYKVDKKTVAKELDGLVAQGHLKCVTVVPEGEKGPETVFYAVPDMDEQKLYNIGQNPLQTTKTFLFEDVLNADVAFYDETERERFHREKVKTRLANLTSGAGGGAKRAPRKKIVKKEEKVKMRVSAELAMSDLEDEASIAARRKKRKYKRKPAEITMSINGEEKTVVTRYKLDKEGIDVLVKCILISRSVKNQIMWDSIHALFPQNNIDVLKKTWFRKRVHLGSKGVKGLIHSWKQILLEAVENNEISLEEIENLELVKLVTLWNEFKITMSDEPVKLVKDLEENYKRYSLVRDPQEDKITIPTTESMVQREDRLLNEAYTFYEDGVHEKEQNAAEKESDRIKTAIRSVLLSGTELDGGKLDVLKTFNKEDVDRALMDMSREKQLSFASEHKLQVTEKVTSMLKATITNEFFHRAVVTRQALVDTFEMEKAMVIKTGTPNGAMAPLLEMVANRDVQLYAVDHYLKDLLDGYGARGLDREMLGADILVTKRSDRQVDDSGVLKKEHPIPSAGPCSRLWIDPKGNINQSLWTSSVGLILHHVTHRPGISVDTLYNHLSVVLSKSEIRDVVDWLDKNKAIRKGEYEGLWLCDLWYTIVG